MTLVTATLMSFALGILLTYLVRALGTKYRVGIDADRDVPRLGGLAIIGSVIVTLAVISPPGDQKLFAFAGALTVSTIGLLDDFGMGRGPALKLAVSLAAAASTLYATGAYVAHINTPPLSDLFAIRPIAIAVSVIALAGMCHGVNLIDGIHGLALSFAVIAFGALGVIAVSVGERQIALVALSLLGACLGLMAFNFPSGSIFLGDVGTYFIGFIAAWIAIYLCHEYETVSPWAMVCIFAYPIVDVGYAAARRGLRGQNPMCGDREHLHHRLMRLTGRLRSNNLRETVIITTLSCAIVGFVPAAIAAMNFDQPPVLMALAATSVAALVSINWIASLAA